MIPKIIFQISLAPPKRYVIQLLKEWAPNHQYFHFTDEGILSFFEENPIFGLEDIKAKFLSLKNGAHKADLFRYYFLYLRGGVYIDSDAMLNCDIESIVKDNTFLSVESSAHPGTIFNGFIASCPANSIIYAALINAYRINSRELNSNYHLLCKNLYGIIQNIDQKYWKLYIEVFYDDNTYAVVNDEGDLILFHYWKNKEIPYIN